MRDLVINSTITIPAHELEISASKAGGPGGQHVNKTSSRITVRWHIGNSQGVPPHLKERLLSKLSHRISTDGYISVHSSKSRSQHSNKEHALAVLTSVIRSALLVPKKRIATRQSTAHHEARLHHKGVRSSVKKQRSSKINLDE